MLWKDDFTSSHVLILQEQMTTGITKKKDGNFWLFGFFLFHFGGIEIYIMD
jgi:hypothetical protein